MWAFSWSRNYFRRYRHTAKPCLYHWRLFRRREIYTRRFREVSAGWLRDHSEYISCTCKNETLLKCSIFVNNFISAIKQYGRLSPWTEARERLHKNFKIKNSKYWSFERKTDSLNFFLKLKAPQCKANGLFATTLPYPLTTNSIGPSNFPSASFSFILRFTIVVKEIECLRNIGTHSRFTRTWESVLCRQFYLPNWLQNNWLFVIFTKE